jgi:predicted nucleic acid-binding Zn finger protein
MNRLTQWDFSDPTLNETVQQVNRQKSALNQEMAFLDSNEKFAVFTDPHDGKNTTTLESCTCRDFNFSGSGVRKKFFPCKHIYRLCFELGIMPVKYHDFKTRWKMMTSEEKREWFLKKLQSYPQDPNEWGNWNKQIHHHYSQTVRQLRAYEIIDLFPEQTTRWNENEIHGYTTTLEQCSCPDFLDRKLPCKHIYVQAIFHKCKLEVSQKDYDMNKTSMLIFLHRMPIQENASQPSKWISNSSLQ